MIDKLKALYILYYKICHITTKNLVDLLSCLKRVLYIIITVLV